MRANHTPYVLSDSDERIREILASADYEYEEKESIPIRDSLTYTNGFYVNCSAMFVDMRGSKQLAEKYKRPTLARIYRAYISELVALFRGNNTVCEIMIEGDCVWGIFDTKSQKDIHNLFGDSGRVVSLLNLLNMRLSGFGIAPISLGIGLDYGRALMIKSGYNGSGINEVVWTGDVVATAAKLCSYGSRFPTDYPVMLSRVIFNNLSDELKRLVEWSSSRDCYHANIIDTGMEEWRRKTG